MSEARKIVLDVKGMTCQGCVNAVTRLIKRADPGADVAIELASGKVETTTQADADALAKAITAGGYEAQIRA